jgi:hypothetical protein
MLRRLVALRHATERIERLESQLRDLQTASAAARSQLDGLLDSAARSERIIADMRKRYATSAVVRTRRAGRASGDPEHVVVNGGAPAVAVPPESLVVVLDAGLRVEPDWIVTASERLVDDADVDAVIGDRIDVVGGRLVVAWADATADPADAATSGAVFRAGAWNGAVAAAGDSDAGDVARRLFTDLTAGDRVAAEPVVAVVAADT